MNVIKLEREPKKESSDLAHEVLNNLKASPDLGLFKCVQCGMCTSTCPAARHSDYDPREMVKRVLENDLSVVSDDKIWNCFYCYTCHSICPSGNSASEVNQILRQKAIKEGHGARKITSFVAYGDSFLEFGIGSIPNDFFDTLIKDFGMEYLDLKVNLDDIRSDLGLGNYILTGDSIKEVGDILKGTGFKDRLEKIRECKNKDSKSSEDKKDNE
ncbi:ferredoxin:CoB-CoM heterodisulfide reductase subunit HdrC [Methanobacterium paludis]|uniref:Heterodisulfide reductase subunit C, HdrC2 n=1 Tax=Methanobacterium paludis (strain DSM 25820 / JCM 18151 / SWAN1) TaxID=868131 RepID=F6D386_METPW|nr:ferredoxin:CoB-CoM heterodisulfide reductase subunit HdrC [Methanobacterium paludis]AEG18026.1 Heterodisulfide reductase subunit C, HdrC2 [Methanobacterium paludis]